MLSVQSDCAAPAACSFLASLGNSLVSLDSHCYLKWPAAMGNYSHEMGSELHWIFEFP